VIIALAGEHARDRVRAAKVDEMREAANGGRLGARYAARAEVVQLEQQLP
jgi:hypothetical protein